MRRDLFKATVLLLAAVVCLVSCGRKYRLDAEDISREGNWTCSRGSVGQLGSLARTDFSGHLDLLWRQGMSGKPAGPLAVHNGSLILPETKKKVRFFDAETGRNLGRLKTKGVPQTGLAVADNLAAFAVSPKRNSIRAHDLVSGKLLWRKRVKDVNPGPIILDNRLYVSSGDGVLLALELDDGELAWSVEFDRRLTASVSYADGKLYQPGDGGTLYGLSVDDGRQLFRVKLDGPIVSPVAVSDRVYAADMLGHVVALDPDDGATIWQTKLDGPIWTSPAVAGDRIYVGHSGGEVVALDADDGTVVWSYDVGSVVRASVLVAGELVIAGTMTGKLVVLHTDDGSLVDSTTVKGAIEFPPVTDGRRLFVATQAGKIVCFGENNEPTDLTSQGIHARRSAE